MSARKAIPTGAEVAVAGALAAAISVACVPRGAPYPVPECDEGEMRACGVDTGACVEGVERCAAGRWSACEGAIEPVAETCADGVDQDCDGAADDGCCTPGAWLVEVVDDDPMGSTGTWSSIGVGADGTAFVRWTRRVSYTWPTMRWQRPR